MTTPFGMPKPISTLQDESAIRDVVYAYCRAVDRCDRELLLDCYFPDAIDSHGYFTGTAAQFADWVLPELSKMNRTSHNITNLLISIEADAATSEAYFIAHQHLSTESGDVDWIVGGRYLDRFERREGRWKIAARRVVYDWTQRSPATGEWELSPLKEMLTRGRRGFDDPVYRSG